MSYQQEHGRVPQHVAVTFCHESFHPSSGSVLGALACAGSGRVSDAPFDATALPFFEAAKACDWLMRGSEELCASITKPDAPLSRRLRAIKLGNEVLLEHTYSREGMLERTRFCDGSVVCRGRDQRARAVRVSLRGGQSLEQRFRPDGSPESIVYPGGKRFDFGYDTTGRLAELRYPDGLTVGYSYEAAQLLARVSVGSTRFNLHWSAAGELEGCALDADGARQELRFASGPVVWRCRGSMTAPPGCSGVSHPLGVWVPDAVGGLSEVITALGDRWVIAEPGSNGPRRVWTSAGQAEYEYDGSGVLSAVVASDGTRSIFHRVSGQHSVLLVSPGGVTLFAYDHAGFLSKIHEPSGAYSLFRRGRSGLVSRIDTLRGKTRLGWNRAGQLASLAWPGGLKCDLARGEDTESLQSFVIHRLVPHSSWRLKALSAGLWSWLAARPALRLEDAGWPVEKGVRQ